jgi:IS5 family transposase
LAGKGLVMREGTIVDATLIAAPPSTKNRDRERDTEMHESKKDNDWHLGMKAHVDMDMATGLVHSVVGTAGNVSDVTQAHALLHGGEKAVLGDAGQGDRLAHGYAAKLAQGAQEKSPAEPRKSCSTRRPACARQGRALLSCREVPLQAS